MIPSQVRNPQVCQLRSPDSFCKRLRNLTKSRIIHAARTFHGQNGRVEMGKVCAGAGRCQGGAEKYQGRLAASSAAASLSTGDGRGLVAGPGLLPLAPECRRAGPSERVQAAARQIGGAQVLPDGVRIGEPGGQFRQAACQRELIHFLKRFAAICGNRAVARQQQERCREARLR